MLGALRHRNYRLFLFGQIASTVGTWMHAIALNSSVFNASAVIGPSIAGVLIAVVGVPVCFLVNSLSYLAAVAALLSMRNLPAALHRHEEQPLWSRLAQGVAYARTEPV